MVNRELVAGRDTFVLYKAESTYGNAVATDTAFQGFVGSASFDVDRQVQGHRGFAGTTLGDGRIIKKYTTGTVQVRGSVEFKVQRFDFLQYVLMGTRTGSGTVGVPYVYPIGVSTQSITVTEELNNATTDSQRTYAGMVINNCSIRTSIGEAVSVSLELIGGKIAKDTSVGSIVANLTDELYNFSGGTIEIPDATSIGNVIDSVDISINNNAEILYGFSQEGVNAVIKGLDISVRFTTKYLDDDQMDRLMGSSTAISTQTPVTLALKFTRAGGQYVDFVFTDVVISKINTGHNLNEFIIEDNDTIASTLAVTEAQS
jgi:hypothetical protein